MQNLLSLIKIKNYEGCKICMEKAEDALITPKLPNSGRRTVNLHVASGFVTTYTNKIESEILALLILALKCARCTYRGSQP